MSGSVLALYNSNLAKSHFETDAAQAEAVLQLDRLAAALQGYRLPQKSALRGWIGGMRGEIHAPRGLYIWGDVGRGKTMLMDLFFSIAPVAAKRRVHFHAFMADVHARIHQWRQARKLGKVKGDDPIAPVARDIADKAALLCFDEFSVTDIADAMILSRLFEALFGLGVVMVATSNVEPRNLYRDGLNRALFLPFIELLQSKTEILHLKAARDFRLEKISSAPVYLVPANDQARRQLTALFETIANGVPPKPMQLPLLGRFVDVPQAANGIARFSFAELCEAPLASVDYLALAQQFHALILDDIPLISQKGANVAKRFINLVDTLYDHHVKLYASAAAPPAGLYTNASGYEAFEFSRTISRLTEMASEEYLAAPHGPPSAQTTGSSEGLVET